jgi:hypothetical protein
LAEEEMAFSASDVSGRERKKEGAAKAVQGVLLFSMDSRQRHWDSHGAWRTRGGKALKPVGTIAAEWFRFFSSSGRLTTDFCH